MDERDPLLENPTGAPGMNGSMGRRGKWVKRVLLSLGAVVVLLGIGVIFPLQVGVLLLFGWIDYLRRILPEVRFDLVSGVSGVVFLVLAGGVGHSFLSWFFREMAPAHRGSAGNTHRKAHRNAHWKARWTTFFLLMVVAIFGLGMAAVGLVHQLSWMVTSDGPVVVSSWGTRREKSPDGKVEELCRQMSTGVDRGPGGGGSSRSSEELERWGASLDSHHLLEIPGPVGSPPHRIVFPRDPVALEKEGVVLCATAGAHPRYPASDLPKLLRDLSVGILPDAAPPSEP